MEFYVERAESASDAAKIVDMQPGNEQKTFVGTTQESGYNKTDDVRRNDT